MERFAEQAAIVLTNEMAIESLSPDNYIELERILKVLAETRKLQEALEELQKGEKK